MNEERLLDTPIDNEFVRAWKAKGKPVMGVICCHVPEELLHAAGILPLRLHAAGCKDSSGAETWMTSYSCSFARSCLQHLMDGTYQLDGLISSDGCLMAARILDNWIYMNQKKDGKKPCYLRQIAAPRKYTPLTVRYFCDELKLVKQELEEFTGTKITTERLQASTELYNETRALIRELYELRKADNPVVSGSETLKITLAAASMPKEDFNPMLRDFLDNAKNRTPVADSRARLMIIGSALDDPEYLKVIEDAGGLIVTDTLCFGSRYLWEPVDLTEDEPMLSLADASLRRIVCPRMTDQHGQLHELMLSMAKDYRVDGVIYQKMQNCECWGGESLYIEKKFKDAGLPLLTVQREEVMSNAGQLTIRAEAFLEMIEQEG